VLLQFPIRYFSNIIGVRKAGDLMKLVRRNKLMRRFNNRRKIRAFKRDSFLDSATQSLRVEGLEVTAEERELVTAVLRGNMTEKQFQAKVKEMLNV
jgi:hypothetical protein